MKLVNKLILSFVVVILLSTVLGFIISNKNIDNKFDDYLKSQKNKMMLMVTDIIQNNYDSEKGIAKTEDIELIARAEGLYIRVDNLEGESIFETDKDYIKSRRKELFLDYTEDLGDDFYSSYYREENYDLIDRGEEVGNIVIGYYRLDNCDIQDIEMKETIRYILIETGLITLVIAIIISIFLARHFSVPLKSIVEATNEIRKGNLNVSLNVNKSTYEIDQLSNSINYLVKTLEKEDMLRKRLTSDMAHEIRTPLTTLQNTIEAFLYGVWEPTKERLESCYEEIIRLTKLVERLKNIARLEEEDIKINIEKFNLTSEIRQTIDLIKPQYENKNIKLDFNYNEEIIINSDKDRVKQIIINLLSNSYNYTNEDGIVEVTLDKIEDKVSISVKDNGIGISTEDLPFIFERFYRVDRARDRKTGGTGIGLTILKALVDSLEGSVDVNSQLGRGSIFTVILPINE